MNNDPKPAVETIKNTLKIYPYVPGSFGTSIGSFLTGKAPLAPLSKPGTLTWRPEMTINEVVSEANGFTAMAKPNAVVVTRKDGEGIVKYTVPVERIFNNQYAQFYMRPGDSVYVPKRMF